MRQRKRFGRVSSLAGKTRCMGVSYFTCEACCIRNSVSYFNFRTAGGISNVKYGFALMEPKITLCKAINVNIKASLRNNCDICGEIFCMYCSRDSSKDSDDKTKKDYLYIGRDKGCFG